MPLQLSELSLRALWERQDFDVSDLRTTAGVPVFVIAPGTPNDDAGPDFRDATVRVGRTTFHGDVEIHLEASSWKSHRHASDPHYNRVVLHVVLRARPPRDAATTSSKRLIPCLALEKHIDPAVFAAGYPDRCLAIKIPDCSPQELDAETLAAFIRGKGLERLERKRRKCETRFRQIVEEFGTASDDDPGAWRQLFYEMIVEGMGFSKNRDAFLRLARTLRIADLDSIDPREPRKAMAAMFTAAGLLPSTRGLPEASSRRYVRGLRKLRRQLPVSLRQAHLHETDWLFFRLRPRNFPTARLATIVFLLPGLFAEGVLERMFELLRAGGERGSRFAREIGSFFQCEPDEYWKHHVHFRGADGTTGVAFGTARARDLIVNAVMPIALLRADMTGDAILRRGVLTSFASMPQLQENWITRLMRGHFAPSARLDARAITQQGLLQLHNEWCLAGRCDGCGINRAAPVGRIVVV